MARYGIATLLGDYPDTFEFTAADTPLHLTHIDVLEIEIEPAEFIRKMGDYVHNQPRFAVMPLADTFLGPNRDIPVTAVALTPELKVFHEGLIRFLESAGAAFENPQFLKEHYMPHISIYGSRRIPLGVPITIKNISIGHKRPDIDTPPNRIIATIPLA